MTTTPAYDAVHQITLTLHRYCDSIDSADFDAFAAIFEHGHWFMVPESGSAPVRRWLDDHVVLHDGHTFSRHEISNLSIFPGDSADEARFTCYLAIWLDLPGQNPRLMVHGRFAGSFHRRGDTWSWSTHEMTPLFMGDVSGHLQHLDPIAAD